MKEDLTGLIRPGIGLHVHAEEQEGGQGDEVVGCEAASGRKAELRKAAGAAQPGTRVRLPLAAVLELETVGEEGLEGSRQSESGSGGGAV